jgi:hypothetical protein
LGLLRLSILDDLQTLTFTWFPDKMSTPDVGKLDLSDSDTEDLFASPSKVSKPAQKSNTKSSESNAPAQRNGESKYDAEQAREASLKKELESVRSINEVIEGVVSSLESAKGNMDVNHLPNPILHLNARF